MIQQNNANNQSNKENLQGYYAKIASIDQKNENRLQKVEEMRKDLFGSVSNLQKL